MANNDTYAYAIKNQWLNMSLYFINFMYNTKKPFGDTAVGKILKSKAFKYTVYTLKTLPSLAFPPLLISKLVVAYASERGEKYIQLWGNVNDDKYVCGYITTPDRLKDNNELLGGKEKNTKWLANGDYIKTDFILLNKNDIISFFENPDTGFSIDKNQLKGDSYKRYISNDGTFNITNQERELNNPNSLIKNNNNILYFLKGTNSNDVITYALSTNVI
jgi:hypothetical protein